MDKKHIDILPGIGLGNLRFGMTREEVTALLGTSSAQKEIDLGEQGTDLIDAWEYHPLRLDLSFEENEDWKLTILSVSSDDYLLEGSSLIGLDMEELMEELSVLGINDLDIEDVSNEDAPNSLLVASEEKGIHFWVNDNIVEEIQWGPLFADEHTIAWPD